MGQQISSVMTRPVVAIGADAPLGEAAREMARADVGALPVTEGDRLVGLVTDRDIVVRALAEGRDPASTRVSEIASDKCVTVAPDDDISDALRLMASHQLRRAPVVDGDGRLVGMVAQADIARFASAQETGRLVEEISEERS